MKRTFIDSGVLIAAATGNPHLAMRAFHILNDPERLFVTSDFVKLEVLPKAEYHQNADEVAFYNDFFRAVEQSVPIPQDLTWSIRCRCLTCCRC